MNKKGFTLIELLAVAVILGLMILAVVPNLLETYNQAKEKEKTLLTERITEAARVYAQNHKNDIDELKKIDGIAYITLQDIVNEGLLQVPIIDPVDNSQIPLTTLIKLTRVTNNNFEIVFNASYPPIITLNGDSEVSVIVGDTYVDAGATAYSQKDGDLTNRIVKTGSVDVNIEGTYTIRYNVADNSGNAASEVQRKVIVGPEPIPDPTDFVYTGSVQTYLVSRTGTYKLEVWGAQGGDAGYNGSILTSGGKGGYATGNINLSEGQTINVYIGGRGTSGNNTSTGNQLSGGYNGGGLGYNGDSSSNRGSGGGGATDIRVGGTALSNRVIVAGAGGGAAYYSSYGTNYPGIGGGTTAIEGYTSSYSVGSAYHGKAGTQSSGGAGGTNGNTGIAGGLGYGGGTNYHSYGTAGGGSGYYGGGGGGTGMASGAGSSYIGGVTSAQTIAGNASMPAPAGGTQTGHAGNGFARITFVSN